MPDNFLTFLSYLAVMAGVTYLVRLLPILFIRKKIKSRFIRSFLYYVPYAVLTVMTIPAIFYSTGFMTSAIIGAAVAIALAFLGRSLITVAAGACVSVLIVEIIIPYLPFIVP